MDNAHQTAAAKKPDPQELVDAIFPQKNIRKLKELLKKGADPNARVLFGGIPVFTAIINGGEESVDILKLLVAHGADLETVRKGVGFTPLMQAANNLKPDVVAFLLEHDVDLHKRTPDGRTALDIASQHRETDIANMLREAIETRARRLCEAETAAVTEKERLRHETVVTKQQHLQKTQRKLILRRSI
jgi:ankyrin repeat protein